MNGACLSIRGGVDNSRVSKKICETVSDCKATPRGPRGISRLRNPHRFYSRRTSRLLVSEMPCERFAGCRGTGTRFTFITKQKGFIMRYLLAIIAPPFALLLCGKPIQFVLNLLLWIASFPLLFFFGAGIVLWV